MRLFEITALLDVEPAQSGIGYIAHINQSAARAGMKSIWTSDAMNALRLQHLEGRRKQNQVCGNCGQLSHCLPDNIDAHRPMLLEKFKSRVAIDPGLEPPGGTNRRFAAVAAE